MHPVCASEVEAQTMRMCAVVNVECHGVWKNATLQCTARWLPPGASVCARDSVDSSADVKSALALLSRSW